jgi:hypothetical protein
MKILSRCQKLYENLDPDTTNTENTDTENNYPETE